MKKLTNGKAKIDEVYIDADKYYGLRNYKLNVTVKETETNETFSKEIKLNVLVKEYYVHMNLKRFIKNKLNTIRVNKNEKIKFQMTLNWRRAKSGKKNTLHI